jgi:hypothetical protein
LTLVETTTALPSYSGQAYHGDEIYQPAFPFPLYVNLLTAKVAQNPQQMLKDHDPAKPIGHHTAVITATGMRLENGVLSVPNAHRDEVAAAAKNGFPWQTSIRGRMGKVTVLKAGETRIVNGRTVIGPAGIVDNFVWRETTATGLGANESGPRLHIEASAVVTSSPTTTPTAPFQVPFFRTAARNNPMMTLDVNDIHSTAIAAKYVSPDALEASGTSQDVIHEALSKRYRDPSFHRLALERLHERNDSQRRSANELADLFIEGVAKSEMLAAGGFSTLNFSQILDESINKIAHARFSEIPSIVPTICEQVDTDSFHPLHSYSLTSGSFLSKLADGGELESLNVSESKSSYAPEDRAGFLTLGRRYLVNNDLSVVGMSAKLLAVRARQTMDRDLHRLILATTWTAENSIANVFGLDGLKAAHALLCRQESDGAPIAVGGVVALVQKSMEMEAKDINKAERVMPRSDNVGSDRTQNNVFHGMLTDVVGSPWWGHKTMGSAASTT